MSRHRCVSVARALLVLALFAYDARLTADPLPLQPFDLLVRPAETLYRDTSAVPAPQPGEAYPPPKRVAILADVQATHEVLSKHAKDHWHKTQGNGPREGEVVTGFLYACKVGGASLLLLILRSLWLSVHSTLVASTGPQTASSRLCRPPTKRLLLLPVSW